MNRVITMYLLLLRLPIWHDIILVGAREITLLLIDEDFLSMCDPGFLHEHALGPTVVFGTIAPFVSPHILLRSRNNLLDFLKLIDKADTLAFVSHCRDFLDFEAG